MKFVGSVLLTAVIAVAAVAALNRTEFGKKLING